MFLLVTLMSNTTHFLDVMLLGKEYRVSCPPDEYDALLAAVEHLNAKLRDVAERAKGATPERVVVMTALNIVHEYLSLKNASTALPEKTNNSEKEVDISGLSRRIKSMEEQLDAVLNPQDRLL